METQNPYQSPTIQDVAVDSFGPARRQRASRGQRFANFLVDYFCYFVLCFVIGMVFALLGAGEAIQRVPSFVFGAIVLLVYYVPQEAFAGRTIGKLVTGTRVIADAGGPPSFAQVIGRTFARMIPFEPFSFFGSTASGWHDSLSHTRVVRN